jgi:NADPH2:quinone reductase
MELSAGLGYTTHPVVTARIPPRLMPAVVGRVDQPMPVGNEGAGVVVKAGASTPAQALMGKTVALFGGAMYAQFRAIPAAQCLVLPEGTTPAEGASCFVNPLTVLGMVGTMRLEGHTALVHTAAASNLGQMLNNVCMQENIGLVNIVRRPEHIDLLKALGARHVYNSSAETFMDELTAALVETGATLAFDAIGGGTLAGQILTGMEMAANKTATGYSRYGSAIHKQVYIYGGLDRSPTAITRNFGMAWGIGGWLLTAFLRKIGPEAAQKLRERVAAEIKTTFASHYIQTVSLAEALQLDAISVYSKQATGEKYLMNPNKGVE